MLSLSLTDAESWCLAAGHQLDEQGRPSAPAAAQRFDIPADAGRRIAVVAGHLEHLKKEPEILVWFTGWGVWPSCERPHIFERLRASYGEMRPLIEVPAHVFVSSEREDALSFVTLGVLFLWDVYAVGASGRRLVHYSHDGVGWIVE